MLNKTPDKDLGVKWTHFRELNFRNYIDINLTGDLCYMIDKRLQNSYKILFSHFHDHKIFEELFPDRYSAG
jgi:hypothetical protein